MDLDPIDVCINQVINYYRNRAKISGRKFLLSRKTVISLIFQDCHYCGKRPLNRCHKFRFCMWYQGIDRMDNSKTYEEGNVVPCCGDCNTLKGKNLSHPETIEVARLLKKMRSNSE